MIVALLASAGGQTSSLASGDITADTQPRIIGTAEAGSIIDVYDGVVHLGTAITDASGHWAFTPSSTLTEGLHTLTAAANDVAGNYGPISNEFLFTVATAVPSVPSITHLIDDVGTITGDIAKGGVTNDARPYVQGTADANAKVSVYIDDTLAGTVTADAAGNWSFTPDADLADGAHRVTATATNLTGESAASEPWAFTLDTVCLAPVLGISFLNELAEVERLVNGSSIEAARLTFSGTAEANSKVEIYDGSTQLGSAVADASGNWSFTPSTNLPLGTHAISAKAIDVAGNVSPSTAAIPFEIRSPWPYEGFEGWKGTATTLASGVGISGTGIKSYATATASDSKPFAGSSVLINKGGALTLTIPGGGAQSVSFWYIAVDSPRSTVANFYDAGGNLLGTFNSFETNVVKDTLFTSPGNLIASIKITTTDTDGMGIDRLSWGSVTMVSSGAQANVDSVLVEPAETAVALHAQAKVGSSSDCEVHTDSGAQVEPMAQPATSDGSVSLTSPAPVDGSHGMVIHALTDTFYGVPAGEGEVVTLQYSADSYFVSASNQGIHGGSGVDTLKLVGGDQTLDLTLPTSQGKLTGIEIIDITGSAGVAGQVSGANTLTLSLKDVLENGRADLFHATDTHAVQMMVKGDGNDIVNLRDGEPSEGRASSWSEQGRVIVGGTSYVVYEPLGRDAELLVQQGVTVNLA